MSQTTKTLLLLLWFTAEAAGFKLAAIDAKKIKLNISEFGHDLILSWSNPEKKITNRCYDTHLQFKSSCHVNWTETYKNETTEFKVNVANTRGSYHFKVRMRYGCRGSSWSAWTSEAMREEFVPCHSLQSTVSPFPQDTANYHILWTLIVVIVILVISLLTQKWFRNNVLQNIPDPKHVQQNMLNFNYPAWWGAQASTKVECEAIVVEEVITSKTNQEEKQEDEKGELLTEKEEEEKKEEEEEEEEEEEKQEKEVDREETVQLLTAVDCGEVYAAGGGTPVPTPAHPGVSYGGGYIHWPSQT